MHDMTAATVSGRTKLQPRVYTPLHMNTTGTQNKENLSFI